MFPIGIERILPTVQCERDKGASFGTTLLPLGKSRLVIIGEIGVVYFVVKKTLSARKYAMRRDLTCSILFAVLFGFGAALLFLVSHNNEYARVVYKVIIAIILALDLVLLHEEKPVKYAFNWVNNTTLCETVFECSQMELPCDVIVYEDGKRIEGRLLNYDLAADDAWILLDIYMIFDDNGKVIGSWECEAKWSGIIFVQSRNSPRSDRIRITGR